MLFLREMRQLVTACLYEEAAGISQAKDAMRYNRNDSDDLDWGTNTS